MDLEWKVLILNIGVGLITILAMFFPSFSQKIAKISTIEDQPIYIFAISLNLIFLAPLKQNWLGISIVVFSFTVFFMAFMSAVVSMEKFNRKIK